MSVRASSFCWSAKEVMAARVVILAFLARQPIFFPASSIEAVNRMTERSSLNDVDTGGVTLFFPETMSEDGICWAKRVLLVKNETVRSEGEELLSSNFQTKRRTWKVNFEVSKKLLTACSSARVWSPRNQVTRGGGRDPWTMQLRVTSFPAESGWSAPINWVLTTGTNTQKHGDKNTFKQRWTLFV